MYSRCNLSFFFFFYDTATTEIYTLSLHDALPICFLAGQIGRLITISTTPVIAGDSFEMDAVVVEMRSEERFSRNAETDLVCRLLLEKKKNTPSLRRTCPFNVCSAPHS